MMVSEAWRLNADVLPGVPNGLNFAKTPLQKTLANLLVNFCRLARMTAGNSRKRLITGIQTPEKSDPRLYILNSLAKS